jgi:hypothetical protein
MALCAASKVKKLKIMNNLKGKHNKTHVVQTVSLTGIIILYAGTAPAQEVFTKPDWLPQLSLGVSEGHDDNLLGVSGNGLKPQSSWYTTISPAIGFNFAPLLGNQAPFQALSLNYTPDFAFYHEAPAENYDAHRFGAAIKGAVDDFSFSLTNGFLYNDGSKIAPTYALNQLSGAAANQFDKFRNQFANTPERDRRNQIQEHEATVLQYDVDKAFIRAVSSLLDYNMDSVFHNTSIAPYKGYQNYVDRSDVNGGADLGYRVTTNVALTLGYRYGSQFQQQFPKSISSDSHYSSSTYQQGLFGLETKPFNWLSAKLAGGPDFRDYNPQTPVYDLHPTKYYGEAAVTATITSSQSLTFNYKQWNWVSATGYVPEFDSSYILNYHWNATRQWGFDLGGQLLEADYTGGYDKAGTAPSVRSDRLYSLAPGVTYAFTPHLSTTVSYDLDAGNNELYTIPSSEHAAAYKNFIRQVVSVGLLYKF